MKTLIEAAGLTKDFETLTAVKDVDLRVAEGEILALLGPNGAGKTTTIRMLASILQPTRGSAVVAGFSVLEQPRDVRRRVGLLTEHHGLYTRMRPVDYLRFFGQAYALEDGFLAARIDELISKLGLSDALDLRLGQFSRGMRQKLALARALLHDPPVLLLDEPTSAMDPSSARLVRESITLLRSSHRAIIVCTHNLAEAELLADRIAIIRRGQIIASGRPYELKQHLLGDPIMELRLAHELDGALRALPMEVTPIATGPDWIRYRTSEPNRTNPRILHAMDQANIQVVTLSEVGRSLEDVYMEVVRAAEKPALGSR
jgi:ABC-2 type transport system ATP-binding protein